MALIELFLTFFKIGLFTFGGGYAMLPLIQEEVINRKWLSADSLINFIAVSESTPGPFAINIATYIGSERGGLLGSFFATLGVVLPSFVIILIVAQFYEKFKESKAVKGVMSGLKPTVVGLIGSAVLSVLLTVFFPETISFSVFKAAQFYVSLGIFLVAGILAIKKAHPIVIICVSALLGVAAGYLIL